MDKTERGRMLRARLKALGGLQPGPGVPQRAKALPVPKRGPGKPLAVFYGVSLASRAPAWVGEPDGQRRPDLRPRRVARKSPLLGIAEKWADALRIPKRPLASRR